jgi:myosin heavy subunit
MSFDYHKVKSKSDDSHGNSWTAYSDLFMMLSTVFLLLYVSVGLRSQTSGIQVYQHLKSVEAENADLKQQLQVYNTLRDNHLKTEGTNEENQVYQKLMSKLSLLQEESKDEKEKLRKDAKENEDKEYALNEYQRLIRNIINTNVLSKTQLQRREVIIEKKDTINQAQKVTIVGQEQEITSLNQTVAAKQSEIAQTQEKIKLTSAELQRKIATLHKKERESEISRAQMNKRIADLKTNSNKMLRGLESQHQAAVHALNQVQNNLAAAQKEAQEKGAELATTQEKLNNTEGEHALQMASLKNQFATREGSLKAAFDSALANERVSGEEKARRQAQFAAAAKARANDLTKQLGNLGEQVKEAQGHAAAAEAGKGRALAAVEGLQKENTNLSTDLKHAQAIANERKELAGRIRGELAKAGLKGTVDGKTGDVTLSFGEEYFDTGSADLKPGMTTTLKKFMPGYSKSLFSDPKISKNIENVEIIGFASSTYKGKYVSPDSLKASDRDAINYNLKLSFNRADSIFKQIFDIHKMSFEHQKDLLPRIKVVGRGYLPDGINPSDIPDGIDEKTFCARYGCKQAQKVIIKFKLKD